MTNGTNLGFIAQEIEQVIPALVVESAEGYKSVDYISMTAVLAVLMEAMKEQQTIIEQQETRIADLEARLDELVQKLGVFNAR